VDSQTKTLLDFFNPSALPYAILILVATALLVKLLSAAAARFGEKVAHRRLIIQQVSTLAGFAAYFFAAMIALTSVFRLSSEALLALSGTIAVAAGLALKDVASSFMAGLSILTTKPFQVGDRISFGGYYGEVREIGLRSVRIVTLDDNLVTVPTNKFLTEAVASANAGALECMVVTDLFLDGSQDHRRALEIVHDAVQASKYLYLRKSFSVLVSAQLAAEGRAVTVITAKAYVYDIRYERAFASDVTDRALAAFQAEGIRVAGAHAA
jgi:small-conductance mechanosensitive channel